MANRRMSEQSLFNSKDEEHGKENHRRKTMGAPMGKENPSSVLKATPGKTPKKVKLGSASAYYFKGVSKTPLEGKRPLSGNNDSLMDVSLASYNGTSRAAETSFLSSSSSSEGDDMLNQSVLSDTTEYTASNYVLATSSRQRLSEATAGNSQLELWVEEEGQRKPLVETKTLNHERRNTLPPGGFALPAPAEAASKPPARRGSLPAAMSVKKLVQYANALKERRLSGQTTRRFSVGSVASLSNQSTHSTRRLSLPSLATPEESKLDTSLASSEKSDLDVSASSIENVFQDIITAPNTNAEEDAEEKTVATGVNSHVSPASTLASSGRSPHPAATITSPRPLPESISYENEQLKAEATSPFRVQPNSHQKLTPTKLHKSPRRVPNPEATDSPAKRTRSATKARLSEDSHASESSPEGHSAFQPDTETKSPFEERLLTAIGSDEEDGSKRKIVEVSETTVSYAEKRRRSSVSVSRPSISNNNTSVLASSLKKAGLAAARKSVAFGSPEVAEYNTTSPSMSMTPLPRHRAKEMYTLPDDTMEIEADMQQLLKQNEDTNLNTVNAGSTPLPKRSQSVVAGDEDQTVELEGNLSALLGSVSAAGNSSPPADTSTRRLSKGTVGSDMSVDSNGDQSMLQDATVELEKSIGNLLGNFSPKNRTRESILGEDHTVELEENLELLIHKNASASPMIELDASPAANARGRRSSIASHRFSLVPTSNFSISIDGDLESGEDSISKDVSVSIVESITEKFDVKNQELVNVLNVPGSSMEVPADGMDFGRSFLGVGSSLLVHESVVAMFEEICTEIDSSDDVDIDMNESPFYPNEMHEQALALQRLVRSDPKDVATGPLFDLKASVESFEKVKWQTWLAAAGESMLSALGELVQSVDEELAQLDLLHAQASEAETELENLARRAVSLSKFKAHARRKVSSLLLSCVHSRNRAKIRFCELTVSQDEIAVVEDILSGLEDRLQAESTRLEAEQQLGGNIELSRGYHEDNCLLSEKFNAICEHPYRSEQSWENTRDLSKLKISCTSKTSLSFDYVGLAPLACVSIKLPIDTFPSHFEVATNDSLFPRTKRPLIRRIKAALPFLAHWISQFNSTSQKLPVSESSVLPLSVQMMNRFLSRMEACAFELSYIVQRYSASLVQDGDGALEGLDVSFAGKDAKVCVFFSIPSTYPFGPVGVSLELLQGKFDIDDLRHVMIKNAKPGFGYLSRTCALIAAHIGNAN